MHLRVIRNMLRKAEHQKSVENELKWRIEEQEFRISTDSAHMKQIGFL